jgi:CheY-like chemotaxis protein
MRARSVDRPQNGEAQQKKALLLGDRETTERQRSLLAGARFQLFEADSVVLGMEVHRRERVDLIACDLEVPGGGVEGFIATLRNDEALRHVAVVVLCGDQETDLLRAARCHANTVLTRSIEGEALLETVERLLRVPDRASYRVLLSVVRHAPTHRPVAFFATSHDISTAGLLLETAKPVEKGDRLSCSFFLPGGRRVAGEGEVVRIASRGGPERRYGVRWLSLPPEARESIDLFVRGWTAKHGETA